MNTKRSWTDRDLVNAVNNSHSLTEVIRQLGLAQSGQMRKRIIFHIDRVGLTTEHFVSHGNSTKGIPLEDILVENSEYLGGSYKVKKKIVDAGLMEDRCYGENCPVTEPYWLGESITLQLDHINGNSKDNRLENLTILCPNCHTQTKTWGRKKRNLEGGE